MVKQAGKKLLVAMLGVCAALTMIFGAITFNRNEKITTKADSTTLSLLDLSKGHTDNAGSGFSSGNTILLYWAAGSQTGSTWGGLNLKCGENNLSDLIVLATADKSQTLTAWNAEDCITRVITYGQMFGINLEKSGLTKSQVVSVTLKAGLAPIKDASGWSDNSSTVGTADMTKALPEDVKLWLNHTYGTLELDSTALSVTSQPDTTTYLTGSTFNASGLAITAATVLNGNVELDVSKLNYSYDFSTAGQKTVTVSYGGQTASIDVTVTDPTRVLSGIAYKSGSVTIEQNGSASEMTLNALKITATYENGSTEDIDITSADMISVDPAELGEKQGKLVYTEGGVKKDCSVPVTVVARTSEYTADNIYVIPLDGYYAGEDGGDRKLEDSGINIWFTTNAGYGKEKIFSGLGEKWYSDPGFEAAHADVKAHVLLNGKTFDALNAEGAGLARYLMGWYGDGVFSLRVHTDGSFKASSLQTVTLLKGFRMYNSSAEALGAPTPCDYTFEVVDKPGTSDKMLVRKTESLTLVSAPDKTTYVKDDAFDPTGMTVKAIYTDGGTKTFDVISRMVSVDTSVAGKQTVTVTYNGKTVTQEITVNEPAATIESIAVKDGAKLFLTQYSLASELTPDAKLVVSYSDNTTEEVALTADMISGYTNETAGNFEATVTYKDKTCKINYTVAAYSGTSTLTSIKYGLAQTSQQQGGVSIEFNRTDDSNLKALWSVNKGPSAIIGKTNGDLVTINGVTVTQLVEEKKVARMWVYGKLLGFHIDDADFMATVKGGAEICILPGFAWTVNSADTWGNDGSFENYTIIEDAVITAPAYFRFKDGVSAKILETVTLQGTPKNAYYKGDVIDVTGLTLSVKYKGFDAETVNLTADMCDYDFTSAGDKTVTITYEDKTVTFDVTVSDVVLTGIELVSAPDKKDYDFGIENELDLTGLTVKAKYDNNTEKEISLDSLTVTGFNSRSFGVQVITLKYGEFEAEFEIEVKNISDNKYLGIDYVSAATSYEGTQHNSLVVSFTMNGVYENLNSFWGAHKLDYVADYMLINGKKVSDLIAEGKVTRLAVWSSQLVIHLDTIYLVPATWVDKRDADHPDAIHYEEGVSEVVDTITFLPGFQWYTVNGMLSGDLWGNDNANQYATPVAGAVLKETITIHNEDGYGWTRPLKKDGDNVASDALEIVSLPTKTTYAPGERLDLSGLQIRAKYEDGGEEIIVPGVSELEGYKKDVLGKQTLTYTYFGQSVSFDITIAEQTEPEKKGCGGCGGSTGIAGIAGLGLVALAYTLKKKRK